MDVISTIQGVSSRGEIETIKQLTKCFGRGYKDDGRRHEGESDNITQVFPWKGPS